MAREYQQGPNGIAVQTSLGTVYLSVTGADHITADAHSGDRFLTVNGVELGVYVHLSRFGDAWDLARDQAGSTYRSINAHRRHWLEGGANRNDASWPAQRKIEAVVVAAVDQWAKANPSVLIEAERARLNNEAHSVECRIEELNTKLAEAQAELSVLEAKERRL